MADAHATAEGYRDAGLFAGLQQGGGSVDLNGAVGRGELHQSVALLTPDARVTWMCHPEPDSAAVFADLLGGPPAGYFSVRSQRSGLPLGQRYLPATMTVETSWPGLLVTDYLVHLDE